MADRNPETSKKNSHSRKKKRNKSSKKKSQNKSFSQSTEKSIFFGKEKGSPLNDKGKISELTTSESDLFTFDRSTPKHQDYNFSRGRTQTFSPYKLDMRHDKHNNSSFSPNRLSNNNSPGAPNFHHEHLCSDKLTYNKFANDSSRLPENVDLVQRIEYLTNQVDFLSRENIRLSDCLHNFNYNWSIHSDSEIDIIFKKKHLEEKFSHVLKKLVSNLLCGHIEVEKLYQFFNLSNCEEKEKSEKLDHDCLFAVDPSADLDESATCVPVYDASFQEILENPNDSKNASPIKRSRGAVSCFNCDEDHHLSSCPHKPDFRRIASARKKAKSFYVPSVRYHVHGKNESEFKPGNISDELREALGLQKNQIPLYVYRMRVLDYPPGWLREAAVESSGMILYDSEGNALKEENCEEGEVDTTAVKVQYDPDKLINYPGFNVPPPPDVIEESEQLGLPPLQSQQLRSYVEKFMAKPDVRPSRKRKIDLPSERASKVQRSEEDMEIEEDTDEGVISSKIKVVSEFVPPLPASEPPPPPPPPLPPVAPPQGEDSETSQDVLNNLPLSFIEENSASLFETPLSSFKLNSCSDFSSGTSSPSLAELVELKKKLVQELGTSIEEEPSSNPAQEDESSLNTDINDVLTSDGLYVFDECVASDASNLSNVSQSDSEDIEANDSETLTRTTSQSKCVALGAPSLSCHSPYSKLPDYGQFSKNVSSHMPFENLPNSTGTYERMKNVLKTVKSKMSSFMK